MQKKRIVLSVVIILAVYVIQFILLPRIKENYYPQSNEAALILLASLALFVIIGTISKNSWKMWLVIDVIYLGCVAVYHGKGLYGIGMAGITLDGAHPRYNATFAVVCIACLASYILLLEITVSLILRVIRKKSQK